jgi:hypothetical protein
MNIPGLPPLSRHTRDLRRIFSRIHGSRAWGSAESASGPGSTRDRAATFLPDLVALVGGLKVDTLLDAACGDFNWAAPLADSVSSYIGVDVVPALVDANRRQHSSRGRRFLCRDIVRQRLPSAQLVLSRDTLVHLCFADIRRTLENFRRTGAGYLLATTFVGDRDNADIPNGDWRPLNLEKPPFSFPPPLELVDERCHHSGGHYADKRFGLWRFRDLA